MKTKQQLLATMRHSSKRWACGEAWDYEELCEECDAMLRSDLADES